MKAIADAFRFSTAKVALVSFPGFGIQPDGIERTGCNAVSTTIAFLRIQVDSTRLIRLQGQGWTGCDALSIVAVPVKKGFEQRICQGRVVPGDLDPGLLQPGDSFVHERANQRTLLTTDAFLLNELQFHRSPSSIAYFLNVSCVGIPF